MPLQKSYDVNCVEGGDTPRRTSPYPGSWIVWLIGFFALCILILVVCLVRRGSSDLPEAQKSSRIQAERPNETGTSDFDLRTTSTPAASANPTSGTTELINNSSSKNSTSSTSEPIDDSGVKNFTNSTSEPIDNSSVENFANSTSERTDDSNGKYSINNTSEPTDDSGVKNFINSTSEPIDNSSVKNFVNETSEPIGESNGKHSTNSTSELTDDSGVKNFANRTSEPTDDSNGKYSTNNTSEPTDDSGVKNFINSTSEPINNSSVGNFTNITSEPTDDSNGKNFANITSEPTDDSGVKNFTNSTSKPINNSSVKNFTNITSEPIDDSNGKRYTNITSEPTDDSGVKNFINSTSEPIDNSSVGNFANSTSEPTDDSNGKYSINNTSEPTDDSGVKNFANSTSKPINNSSVGNFTNITSEPTDDSGVKNFANSTSEPINNSSVGNSTNITSEPSSGSSPDNQHESAHDGVESHFGSRVASQMLFYMNHSADTCEDFYEYACGGFEANQLMSENDLADQATKRIFDQAKVKKTSGQDTEFQNYYQSCVTYNKNSTESQRIEFAKKAISEVGKFYGPKEWDEEVHFNFTTMLSKLFLRNSAPFFDITADILVDDQKNCADKGRATNFTWKLSPPVLEGNSYREKRERDCYNLLRSAMLEKDVDLRELQKNHTSCKNNLEDFLVSVQEAMKLSDLDDEDIRSVRFGIEFEVMPAFYKTYPENEISKNNPTEGEIRHALLTKNYKMMKIEELQSELPEDNPFLDWKQLLRTLKGSTVDFEQPLQVYFSDVILKGLREISDLPDRRHLHNAILALYAHKIYYEFVVPPPDVETHCKRVATSLMGTHASSLYMSSFSSEELADMKETVIDVFGELKKTLESGLENASWLDQPTEKEIVTKIQDLTIEIPDASYYQNDHKLNPESSLVKRELTGEFVHDTMVLQKNYRKSMYEVLDKSPSDYEQIWTHFGLPYQTTGSAIYELNKIVMPYGAIDWSDVRRAQKMSSRHLVLATLGTRIADLMAHHLDSTGVEYFAGRRNKKYLPVFCNEQSVASTYKAYVEDTKLFADRFERLFLSSTEQDVSYKMTDLSLNERISSAIGLKLAYDTMSRLPSESKKLLPWLTNESKTDEKKQFFLAYAQMHCTKVPLTSSFVSLNETEHLPSRLRILVAAASNEALGSTWECNEGTNVRPGDAPSHFPHLKIVDADDGQQYIE